MSEKTSALIHQIAATAAELPEPDLTNFLTMIGGFSIQALRGLHGDDYVDGFLQAAANDNEGLVYAPGGIQ